MTNQHVRRSSPDVLVLAYKAEAMREGSRRRLLHPDLSARIRSLEADPASADADIDRCHAPPLKAKPHLENAER
jgi:hypothetical protein